MILTFLSRKEKLLLAFCVLVALASCVLLFGDFDVIEHSDRKKIGTIQKKMNQVRRKTGSHYFYSDLREGKELYRDDVIFVGPESWATLSIDKDNMEIHLSENSLIKLSSTNENLQLDLRTGSLKVSAAGKTVEVPSPKNFIIKKKTKRVVVKMQKEESSPEPVLSTSGKGQQSGPVLIDPCARFLGKESVELSFVDADGVQKAQTLTLAEKKYKLENCPENVEQVAVPDLPPSLPETSATSEEVISLANLPEEEPVALQEESVIPEIALPEIVPAPIVAEKKIEELPVQIRLLPIQLESRFVRAQRVDRRNGMKSFVEINIKNYSEIRKFLEAEDLDVKIELKVASHSKLKGAKKYVFTEAVAHVPVSDQKSELHFLASYSKAKKREPSAVRAEIKGPQLVKEAIAFEDASPLKSPQSIYPRQNQIHFLRDEKVNSVTFAWRKEKDEAKAYEIELSQNEDFSEAQSFQSKDAKFTLKASLESGTYFWRVRSFNDFIESPWSQPRSFTAYKAKKQ